MNNRNDRAAVFTVNPEFNIVMNKAMAAEIVDYLEDLVSRGEELPQPMYAMYRTLQSKVADNPSTN